jgi:hypothetical protein
LTGWADGRADVVVQPAECRIPAGTGSSSASPAPSGALQQARQSEHPAPIRRPTLSEWIRDLMVAHAGEVQRVEVMRAGLRHAPAGVPNWKRWRWPGRSAAPPRAHANLGANPSTSMPWPKVLDRSRNRGNSSPTLQPIALVCALEVVEAQVLGEVALHRGDGRVVGPPEGAAPQLGQDRSLQPLHKAIGPGMPGLRAPMLDAEGDAGMIEGPWNSLLPSVRMARTAWPARR